MVALGSPSPDRERGSGGEVLAREPGGEVLAREPGERYSRGGQGERYSRGGQGRGTNEPGGEVPVIVLRHACRPTARDHRRKPPSRPRRRRGRGWPAGGARRRSRSGHVLALGRQAVPGDAAGRRRRGGRVLTQP